MSKSKATCHPDRDNVSHGRCYHCAYLYRKENAPPATCHPERPCYRLALGLCLACYGEHRKVTAPRATCHPEKQRMNRDGLCVDCISKIQWQKNKDTENEKQWARKALVWSKTMSKRRGFVPCSASRSDLETVWEAQAGKCACCANDFTCDRDAHMDHDHVTGKFRGFLCTKCNMAEGLLRTIKRAEQLHAYVLKHRG